MSWNFRVVRKVHEGGIVTHGIHEAHYDDANKVRSVTVEPTTPESVEGLTGLRWFLREMEHALERPVVEYDDVAALKAVGDE